MVAGDALLVTRYLSVISVNLCKSVAKLCCPSLANLNKLVIDCMISIEASSFNIQHSKFNIFYWRWLLKSFK